MRKHIIELNDRELYLLWTIACWFDKPVTHVMREKLAGLAWSDEREKYQKYDRQIETQIIDLGQYLQKKRETED